VPRESYSSLVFFYRPTPLDDASSIGAVEQQLFDFFGVAGSIFNGHRAALRDAE